MLAPSGGPTGIALGASCRAHGALACLSAAWRRRGGRGGGGVGGCAGTELLRPWSWAWLWRAGGWGGLRHHLILPERLCSSLPLQNLPSTGGCCLHSAVPRHRSSDPVGLCGHRGSLPRERYCSVARLSHVLQEVRWGDALRVRVLFLNLAPWTWRQGAISGSRHISAARGAWQQHPAGPPAAARVTGAREEVCAWPLLARAAHLMGASCPGAWQPLPAACLPKPTSGCSGGVREVGALLRAPCPCP